MGSEVQWNVDAQLNLTVLLHLKPLLRQCRTPAAAAKRLELINTGLLPLIGLRL